MDEEEIDIEGDYTSDLGASEATPLYFDNELPSTSVNLTPEFSQHPWMLEQGWANDYFMDEKSKATIEKMLLEEEALLGENKIFSPRKLSIPSTVTVNEARDVDGDKTDEHLNHVEYEAILMDNDGVPTSDASFPNLLGATTTCITSSESPQEKEFAQSPISPQIKLKKPPKKVSKLQKVSAVTKGNKKTKVGRPRAPDVNTVICHSETINISSKTSVEDEDVIVDIEADDDVNVDDALPLYSTVQGSSQVTSGETLADCSHHDVKATQNGTNDQTVEATEAEPETIIDEVHVVTESLSKPNLVENIEVCVESKLKNSVVKSVQTHDAFNSTALDCKQIVKEEEPLPHGVRDEDEISSETDISAFDDTEQPEVKPNHWGGTYLKGSSCISSKPRLWNIHWFQSS